MVNWFAIAPILSLCSISTVPPKIESFAFPFDGLPEGARTRVICGVAHGDPPLTIRWLKDGKPLGSRFPVNVSELDSFSSLLSINAVTAGHSGEYTCVASNTAAEARYSSRLQVKGNSSSPSHKSLSLCLPEPNPTFPSLSPLCVKPIRPL